jgi:hypothetical protein
VVRIVLVILAAALVAAAPAGAEIRVVRDLSLEREAGRGAAVGLYVPGPLHGREFVFELLRRSEGSTLLRPAAPGTLGRLRIGRAGPPLVLLQEPERGAEGERGHYGIAVVGGGFVGVLTSDSTRLRGLVTLDDVVEGRLESRPDGEAAATVGRLGDRISRNDGIRLPLTMLVVAAVLALALLRPRLAPRAVLLALALNLWLSPALALAAALAAVALPLGPACLALLAVYLAALGLDTETVALSPLGPSQVSRFYGIDNLLETLLLLPALLGAALLGRRLGLLLAGIALVAVAGNRFGADGGGLLVLLAGFGVLAWRLSGRTLTWRSAALLAVAAALAGLALVGLDAATGGSSHVTSALGDGPGALAGDLGDRLRRSVERTWDSKGALVVVVAGLAVLAWTATRRGEPVLDALLAALAVSLLVNDTPSDVLAAGAACAVTLVRLQARPYARRATLTGFRRPIERTRERQPPGTDVRADRQPAGPGEPPG